MIWSDALNVWSSVWHHCFLFCLLVWLNISHGIPLFSVVMCHVCFRFELSKKNQTNLFWDLRSMWLPFVLRSRKMRFSWIMKHASFSVSLMWLLHDVFHSLMFLKSCAISFIRAFEVALIKLHRDAPQCPLWSQRETAAVQIIFFF